jgi:hypothetical protein
MPSTRGQRAGRPLLANARHVQASTTPFNRPNHQRRAFTTSLTTLQTLASGDLSLLFACSGKQGA